MRFAKYTLEKHTLKNAPSDSLVMSCLHITRIAPWQYLNAALLLEQIKHNNINIPWHICFHYRSTYKCGVFLKDISPNVPLAWLEAMPDAIVRARKEGATDEDIIELLGSNLDGTSYENYECGDQEANSSCYAQVDHLLLQFNLILCVMWSVKS